MTYKDNIFQKKTIIPILFAVGFMFTAPITVSAHDPGEIDPDAVLPELRAIVPDHLQVVHKQQSDELRFTNGIANLGPGHWQMIPDFPENPDDPVIATQQLLDVNGIVVDEFIVSEFDYHEEHNHWHIASVVEFSIHKDTYDGPLVGESNKVTFCIEDVYSMTENSNTSDRLFWDCTVSLQGVQAGWADQYHQSTPGNQIDITGIDPGFYYLVHHVNPDDSFIEEDDSNNIAWTEFIVTHKNNGQVKITETGITSCDDLPDDEFKPALCGEITANRG